MQARTLRVSAGILMVIGAWVGPLKAQDRQVITKQTNTMRIKTQAAAVMAPRANQKNSIAFERSGKSTTVHRVGNSSNARVTRHSNGVQTSVSKPIQISQGLRKLSSSKLSITPLNTSNVAGGIPGTTIYRNDDTDSLAGVYTPGAGQRMADDLILAGGGCDIVYYSLVVLGFDDGLEPPSPLAPYDVTVALWDDDPCNATANILAGSVATFTDILSDSSARLLEVTLPAPVSSPDTVWLAATFSTDDAGWFVVEQAEVGDTADFWSEDNTDPLGPNTIGCILLGFTGAHSGFWASVNCNLSVEPPGACCNGSICREVTESVCTTGIWQGAFTTCSPSPCLNGACCSGDVFQNCLDTTEALCRDGFFHAEELCSNNACTPMHIEYANTAQTFIFTGIGEGEIFADDISIVVGSPGLVTGYEVLVAGDNTDGPDTFIVTLSLRENVVDVNNPDPLFDLPGVLIPGTEATFLDIPADQSVHRLLVSVDPPIVTGRKFWVQMTTNAPRENPHAGIILGGLGKFNESDDAFVLCNSFFFNDPDCLPGIWFLGWSPDTNCEGTGPGFCPHGSGRITIFVEGDRPTGACCDDVTGACDDGSRSFECDGRFVENKTCAENPFNPPCGTGACCSPGFTGALACQDKLVAECAALNGSHDSTTLCTSASTPCPSFLACVGGSGSCFTARSLGSAETGCDNTSCCERVCSVAGDEFCCDVVWDAACAESAINICDVPPANDEWFDAEDIAGELSISFDNTLARNDGVLFGPDEGCTELGDIDTITHSLYYCWTSPCSDTVFVQTCAPSTVSQQDTKVVVHGDCSTQPSGIGLVDCNDDSCNFFQSQVSFSAIKGNSYLIEVGSFPGQDGGSGVLDFVCGPPVPENCPGSGDCCDVLGTGSPGCSDVSCCSRVCACDPFCCTNNWDIACSTNGFEDDGCGAAILCQDICGVGDCPAGMVEWIDPPNGVVDARMTNELNNPAALLGIDMIQVNAPVGANSLTCWSVCETPDTGATNTIVEIVDLGIGDLTLVLERPITPGKITTISYTGDAIPGDAIPGVFTFQPANVNNDAVSDANDVLALIDLLNGAGSAPWGTYSSDINHSGETTSADVLRVIDLLNGAESFNEWNNFSKPAQTGCP